MDFGKVEIMPTYYCLESKNGSGKLKNWNLEGYNGAIDKWEIIKEHKDDTDLLSGEHVHLWKIDFCRSFYSRFRIHQTGFNSDRNHYLTLSGFEIYGEVLCSLF